MKYDKPPISFEEQADRIIQRGLIVEKSLLVDRLKSVNYYRLSGYLFPYRQSGDTFKPGTTFEQVWRHYTFDRRLRLAIMDGIERIEVSIRTQLIYALAHATQAFGYTDPNNLPGLKADEHSRLLKTIIDDATHSKEIFVGHFRTKYGDVHANLPLWVVGEVMSFGATLTMYRGSSDTIKQDIASHYRIPDEVLTSWLKTINVIRNICAHHSRLWNRELGFKPYIPRKNKYPEWHEPVVIPQNRVFGILTIIRYLLTIIAPQSRWEARLLVLLGEYSEISRQSMGFPDNWKDSPLWK